MLKYLNIKNSLVVLTISSLLSLSACSQSPIRNPFEKRSEPKLSELPNLHNQPEPAKLVWAHSGDRKSKNAYNELVPIAHGAYIYTADQKGKLSAMQLSSGKKLWAHKSKLRFTAGPEYIEGKLILAAKNLVLAYDPNTGEELWRRKVSSEVLSAPKGHSEILVAHASDGTIIGLSLVNGQILWETKQSTPALSLRTKSSPAIQGDKVLVGLSNGKVMVLNLYSGMVEWEHTLVISRGRSELQRMVDISADPLIINNIGYVIAYQGKLAALDMSNHKVLWERKISSYQNIAHDAHNLYVTDDDYTVWAIDQKTGTTLWKQGELAKRFITSPNVQNQHVVVADRGGYVHWLDAQTGHIKGHLKTGKKIYQQPIVSNRYVLVSEYDGKLSLLNSTPRFN